MSDLVKVDLRDDYRALLTEVLPYELPIWYTNFNMYQRFNDDLKDIEKISGIKSDNGRSLYIPLNYLVCRGGGKYRELTIMHPAAQKKVCDFYSEYADLIEYYCGISPFSLRYPSKKATCFFGKYEKNSSEDKRGVECVEEDRVYSSSYFKYKRYSFLYKFFESYDYHRLEKKFCNMLQVDVAKCFPSIYTHSIGWATKGKRTAKINKGEIGSFDGQFDDLMQLVNYRETNGIIIGPEVSRIFAEIILQRVDLDISERLEREEGLTVGKDYGFRRYVDDYFIFYRDENVKKLFIKSLEISLLKYKMYLNDAKTVLVKRPFATELSLVKNDLKKHFVEMFSVRYKEDKSIASCGRPDRRANGSIAALKMTIAEYNVEYHSISNYLLHALDKGLNTYLKKAVAENDINLHHVNWILVDLDVLFFVHAMDIRIRPTDRLAKTINYLLSVVDGWDYSFKDLIHKKIFDQIRAAINIYINQSNDIAGVETLNLLVMLTMLPESYKLSSDQLFKYYESVKSDDGLSSEFYFSWVTFMLYMRDDASYGWFRRKIIAEAIRYFRNHEDGFQSAEFFLLFFDFISCPHVDRSVRSKMLDLAKKKIGSAFNKSSVMYFLNKDFVVEWRDSRYLIHSLNKRKYIFPYN